MKLITTLILIFSISIFAQDRINYITYGSDASINEGDDDHHQILIIKVPANRITPIYVKIFDADIGGDFDMPFGPWNTTTKFTLLGGEGAVPETLKAAFPDSASMHSGEVIESVTFGEDINANADWITLANVMPFLGDSSDGYFEFKLLVEGNNGNDANVYDVLVSDSEFDNHQSESVELFAYEVTIRLTQFDNYASVRFMTPLNQSSIEVNHFDAGTSDMSFETPFRTFKMTSRSGQGNWVSQKIALEDVEQNTLSEIHFGQGGESPNDATFYITDANLKALPILLPIIDGKSNKRPVISKTVNKLSDCFSVVFDASGSMDPDGDQLKYLWDFGDGTEESGARVVHKYQLRTDYPVTLLVFDNSNQVANSSFEKFIVNINQPPKAEFNFPSVVAPNQKINFDANSSTDQDGDIILYTWTFGDGVVKNGKVISHSFAKTGTYSVQLVVTDDSDSPCNSTSITKAIKVNETPLARAGDDLTVAAGDNVKFDAAKSIDPDGEISSYTWDFGNGLIKNGLSVNHTFSEPGQYPVTLKISDDASVENSYSEDLLIVNVNYPPKADAGADKNVAKGELILFSGQGSSDQDGQIIKYEWDFGDGEKGVGANVSHVYSEAGRYSVKLTVTDNSGTTSASTSDDLLVNVNSAPTANAGSDIVVTRGTVQFDGSGSTDSEGGNLSYLWDFGDGNTSNEKSPSHLYNNSGEYLVKLIVTDNSGTKNNRSTDQLKVIVNQKPIADAGPDRTVVPNQKVQFDGSNSFDPDGEIVKYVWDFGDGNTAEGKIVEHLYENSGSYSVTLRVEDNTGHESAYDFDESALVVNKAPIADAGLDIVTYPGKEVLLTGVNSKDEDGSIVSYSWTISGFNETHNQRDVKRSFEKSGVYKATLTVKDNSGLSNSISTDFVLIRVNETPVADAGENIKSCNSIITFDASQSVDADGDALNYIWDFGDGSPTENGVKVIHDFVNGGNFPVTLTVDDGLGLPNSTSTSTITVSINQPPLADAGADRIICAGNVAIFNGSASSDPEEGVLVYYWDFGDGTKAEGINTTKSYSVGGIYEVTLKIEDDSGLPCNSDVDRLVVKVVEAPVANAGQDITVCANSEVKFDGSKSTDFDGVVNSYFWNFGDGTTGGGASPTHIFSQSGKYKVTLTITGDVTEGCDNSDTDELIVNVIAAPEAKFTSVDKAPVNTQVFFDASLSSVEGSEIVEYAWDFGDGTKGNGLKTSHSYSQTGNYVVSLQVRTNSGTDCELASFSKLIKLNESPIARAGEDISTGVNIPVVFNGSASSDIDGSITDYEWDFSDGNNSQGLEVRHQFSEAGTYNVILRVTDDTDLENNYDIDTIKVSVNNAPNPVISSENETCVGSEITFNGSASTDDGEIIQYDWDFGDGNTAKGITASHTYSKFGIYDVKLTVTDNSALDNSVVTIAKKLIVNSQPNASAVNIGRVCPNDLVQFDGSLSTDVDSKELSFRWNFGDGSSSTEINPTHSYSLPGRYQVELKVNDNSNTDCDSDSYQFEVIVNSAPKIEYSYSGDLFTGGANDQILFDASKSIDADGDAIRYIWDFGDGTVKNGAKVFHQYISEGTYTVVLSAIDLSSTACSESKESFELVIKKR